MEQYIKQFTNHAAYNAVKNNLDRPNVVMCQQEGDLHYNPIPPKNIITYIADTKLTEIIGTTYTTGLHINSFSGINGQLIMTSHTFKNGVGTIEFNGDIINIGQNAFYNCDNITNIIIPDSVTSIGESAFSGCSGLTSIDIPRGVTNISNRAFSGCSGLTSIDIPNGVTTLDTETFWECRNLSSVIMPNRITVIGLSAFGRCTNLTNIEIPNSVTSIDLQAFYHCEKLTSVNIPNSVTNIGCYAFQNCESLTSVTIGSGITSIPGYVFAYCNELTSIISLSATAPTISSDTFRDIKTNGTLYVPQGSTGYDTWMQNTNYYLGLYNWTKVEQ